MVERYNGGMVEWQDGIMPELWNAMTQQSSRLATINYWKPRIEERAEILKLRGLSEHIPPEEVEEYGTVDKLGKFRAIATPMGIIPINESTASGKIFNFWVGHTNFDITNALALIIEETPGVETLDIFTRYRFRIGIGKAFHDSKVMRDINSRVYNYLIFEFYPALLLGLTIDSIVQNFVFFFQRH